MRPCRSRPNGWAMASVCGCVRAIDTSGAAMLTVSVVRGEAAVFMAHLLWPTDDAARNRGSAAESPLRRLRERNGRHPERRGLPPAEIADAIRRESDDQTQNRARPSK